MNFIRWACTTWIIAIGVILALFEYNSVPTTEVQSFCAYGRLFVEFDEGGKRWGTIMLDFNGKPIPCSESDIITPNHTVNKERKKYDQSV